ncbi:hypothetical protein [Deinococcus malanensis]|nr:hypothetical protein [Deinococcus malanensis]
MSLTHLIREDPQVRARLKEVLRKPRITAGPMLVEPRSRRYNVTGTAFDYLLRFTLERRHPDTCTRHPEWVADLAARQVRKHRKRALNAVSDIHVLVRQYRAGASVTEDVARACTVLAKLDLVYRAGWEDPDPPRPRQSAPAFGWRKHLSGIQRLCSTGRSCLRRRDLLVTGHKLNSPSSTLKPGKQTRQ